MRELEVKRRESQVDSRDAALKRQVGWRKQEQSLAYPCGYCMLPARAVFSCAPYTPSCCTPAADMCRQLT